jgi:hypothetical protein
MFHPPPDTRFVEMASRVLKHQIKRKWREQLALENGYGGGSTLKKVLVSVFTDLSSSNREAWSRSVCAELERYFEVAWPVALRDSPVEKQAEQPLQRVSFSAPSNNPLVRKPAARLRGASLASSTSSLPSSSTPSGFSLSGPLEDASASPAVPKPGARGRSSVNLQSSTVRRRASQEESSRARGSCAELGGPMLISHDVALAHELASWALPVLVHRLCGMLNITISARLMHAVDNFTGKQIIVRRSVAVFVFFFQQHPFF